MRTDSQKVYAHLPYEFLDKLAALIESIPADEFEGCLDGVESDI
jgi:hypothetical protein